MADVAFKVLKGSGLATGSRKVIHLYIFSNKICTFISSLLFMQNYFLLCVIYHLRLEDDTYFTLQRQGYFVNTTPGMTDFLRFQRPEE